ncbi:hypothetical protein OUZ56_024029 [Daphnia magna]|uniref:Uncharacterized protein n=1 Tax=Daphnia magna TaxID=35525 RepID=A0ABR0AZX8_9CRUS|nr:hypothetical protein OUZ56_024029 [Daphnia magna]
MTSVPSEEETGNPIDDVAETEKRNIEEKERQEEELHKALLKFPVIQPAQPFGRILKSPKEPAAPDVHPFTAFNLKQPSKMEWTILRCLHPKMYRNGPLTSVVKRETDSEWIAHHKEAEDQRKKKRVETIYGKTSGYLAATRTEAAASDANKQSNGGRKQLSNMQLLSRGQLDEDDPPNQQPQLTQFYANA